MSMFGFSRSVVAFSSVVGTGVALKPASSRPLTIASLALTASGSSLAKRNLIS